MHERSGPRSDIVLRPTRAADGPALLQLRLRALKEHPTAFGSSYEETLRHTVDEWTARADRGSGAGDEAIFVADAGGEPVGMTGIRRGTSLKGSHAADVWGVYVRPEWRGHGLARRLVDACADWARDRGVHIVRLTVVTDNAGAARCYQRAGFEVHGVEPGSLYVDGAYYDELLMHRWLVPRAPGRERGVTSGSPIRSAGR
jgi:RimJ/RimL family protein N-acetyltransferase